MLYHTLLCAITVLAVVWPALLNAPSILAAQPQRQVQYYGAFREANLSSVAPEGWLREYLLRQRNGLTGHLEAAGYPFNTDGWRGTEMNRHGWVPYEQNAYWVDGMMRCGELLGDSMLVDKALKSIDYVLQNADPDGYLGPKFLKAHSDLSRWPHVVFFRALMARYSATGDPRILEALHKHYLSRTDPYSSHRNVVNVEIMLWTYAQTRDPEILRMAEESYAAYNRTSKEVTTLSRMRSEDRMEGFHGVTFNETAKLAAILYLYTGKQEYLEAVEHAYQKIDRWYMLLDGVHSSTEGFRGNDPLQSHETCDITDYTWALGYLLMATGKAEYADKIERACFNAAPGAVLKDFKGLQYFSCPNQVVADRTSNHNEFQHGSAWMSYRPNPGTECCAGNVHRIMPDYVGRMWMLDSTGGPVAALYGPSRFSFRVGSDTVSIVEETSYPFEEEIRFTVLAPRDVRVPFTLRVPSWCQNPQIALQDGDQQSILTPRPGTFERIERTFHGGERIIVKFPMMIRAAGWPDGGVSLERGPLVYALAIPHSQEVDTLDRRSTADYPAWNMEPRGNWNYALSVSDGNLEKYVRFERHATSGFPWEEKNAPSVLRVPARLVRDWALQEDPKTSSVRYTPPLPVRYSLRNQLSREVDTLTLIPYGCTELRLSIFPLDGDFAALTGREPEAECTLPSPFGEDSLLVSLSHESDATTIRYTLDGSEPTESSLRYEGPFVLTHSATIKSRTFGTHANESFVSSASLVVLHRLPSVKRPENAPGLAFNYFEGSWDALPEFASLKPARTGAVANWGFDEFKHRDENWAATFRGYITVPVSGLYTFFLTSDDGSRLLIDGTTVVDNDGPHGAREREGYTLLEAGAHQVQLLYFQGTGGKALSVEVTPPGMHRQSVPDSWLTHDKKNSGR